MCCYRSRRKLAAHASCSAASPQPQPLLAAPGGAAIRRVGSGARRSSNMKRRRHRRPAPFASVATHSNRNTARGAELIWVARSPMKRMCETGRKACEHTARLQAQILVCGGRSQTARRNRSMLGLRVIRLPASSLARACRCSCSDEWAGWTWQAAPSPSGSPPSGPGDDPSAHTAAWRTRTQSAALDLPHMGCPRGGASCLQRRRLFAPNRSTATTRRMGGLRDHRHWANPHSWQRSRRAADRPARGGHERPRCNGRIRHGGRISERQPLPCRHGRVARPGRMRCGAEAGYAEHGLVEAGWGTPLPTSRPAQRPRRASHCRPSLQQGPRSRCAWCRECRTNHGPGGRWVPLLLACADLFGHGPPDTMANHCGADALD